jgi:hypothetical protein
MRMHLGFSLKRGSLFPSVHRKCGGGRAVGPNFLFKVSVLFRFVFVLCGWVRMGGRREEWLILLSNIKNTFFVRISTGAVCLAVWLLKILTRTSLLRLVQPYSELTLVCNSRLSLEINPQTSHSRSNLRSFLGSYLTSPSCRSSRRRVSDLYGAPSRCTGWK